MHKLAEKPACYSVTINKFIHAWDFPRNLQVTILPVLSRFWKPGGLFVLECDRRYDIVKKISQALK